MDRELLLRLSLPLVPHIGTIQAKILVENFGSASAIFTAKESALKLIEGIGEIRARSIKSFKSFTRAEEEIKFIHKYGITPLFMTDEKYPKRLLNCYDSPVNLFFKGEANLNSSKIVAIIGTRNNTEYGRLLTESLIEELASLNVLIISGLAFGIDAIAHKAAVRNHLSTVGVLGHGLDQIYPSQHSSLAKEMIKNGGGLLTEFLSGTNPDKHNFPSRNRIVSGMSDATIVVETGIKGGSMITAELANDYNKDVFAFPGRVTDPKSMGCNHLIRHNKAMLLNNATELVETLNWNERTNTTVRKQKQLFIDLSENEKKIVSILEEKTATHIDELNGRSCLSNSTVAATVLELELRNIVRALPGKLYRLT
jgi:DNA processing protein